jgi:hypothetical protein
LLAPARRVLAWSIAWVFSAALYWLLIDTRALPELIVGVLTATIAATGAELARAQGIVGESIRARWLLRIHRPLLKLPSDVLAVSAVAIRQLLHVRRRPPQIGRFRAFSFRCAEEQRRESGRHAMAESFGSFAPNMIIVGVDPERQMILGHQLEHAGGREAVDILELG